MLTASVTTAVDKWPAYARILAIALAGHIQKAPAQRGGTQPIAQAFQPVD